MRKIIACAAALSAIIGFATEAGAKAPPPPPPPGACDVGLTTPDAIACAGYFTGNLLNGSPADLLNQQNAIASLPGTFTWDGNWSGLENSTSPDYVITSLTNGNQLDFGTMLFGPTIVGAHFGNVFGPDGNVSVFWLFDFGSTGARYVTLDHPEGFSNAALYTTEGGAVPEPATWAMMLIGFAAVGAAERRRRRVAAPLKLA